MDCAAASWCAVGGWAAAGRRERGPGVAARPAAGLAEPGRLPILESGCGRALAARGVAGGGVAARGGDDGPDVR